MPGCTSSNLTAKPARNISWCALMTPGLAFALGAMICFGASDLIYKRAAAAGIQSRHFAMLQSWVFGPSVTLYAWTTGTLHPHLSALWGALAGLFLLIAV